jgi:hypothetical protein
MTTPNAAEGRRDDAELAEFLAEMMHTGYRHGIDNQQAMQIWRLIQEMPDRDWGAYAGYVSHYLQQYLDKRDTSLIVRLEAAERVVAAAEAIGFPLLSWATVGGTQGVECCHCNEWGETRDAVIHMDDCEGVALGDALAAAQRDTPPGTEEEG